MAKEVKAKKPMVKKPVVKKKKKKIETKTGAVHIHASPNNTIVTLTDLNGAVLAWASAGTAGYKGTKKSTPYAAGMAANQVAEKAKALGINEVIVYLNGVGQGKDTAIRSIDAANIKITELNDVTPIPHNGCKPPKKPR